MTKYILLNLDLWPNMSLKFDFRSKMPLIFDPFYVNETRFLIKTVTRIRCMIKNATHFRPNKCIQNSIFDQKWHSHSNSIFHQICVTETCFFWLQMSFKFNFCPIFFTQIRCMVKYVTLIFSKLKSWNSSFDQNCHSNLYLTKNATDFWPNWCLWNSIFNQK